MRIVERLRHLDDFVAQNGAHWVASIREIYRQQPSRVGERMPGPLGFITAWMRMDQAARTAPREDQATNDR